jgi:hypothetical protein
MIENNNDNDNNNEEYKGIVEKEIDAIYLEV